MLVEPVHVFSGGEGRIPLGILGNISRFTQLDHPQFIGNDLNGHCEIKARVGLVGRYVAMQMTALQLLVQQTSVLPTK